MTGERKRQIQKWDLGDALQTASGGRNLTVQNTGCSWPREWLDGSVVGRAAVKNHSGPLRPFGVGPADGSA